MNVYTQYDAKGMEDQRYLSKRNSKQPSAILDYESSSTYYEKIMQSPRSLKNSARVEGQPRSGREDSKLAAFR